MTVRLLERHSLLVGLLASLASLGGLGCADDKSKSDLDPEGPPAVRQVFVLDPVSTDDGIGGEYALTYGIHPDAWECGVVDLDCPELGDNCGDADTTNNQDCLECATTGEFEGHCVFTANSTAGTPGETPGATSAVAAGASIRIVSKELLDGKTLEQFACACFGSEDPGEGATPEACGAGGNEWAVDPTNCQACSDNPDTSIDESGRCLDANNDRIPDLATMQAGIAVIDCGVTDFPTPGAGGSYTTQQGDGFYYPSGNQLVTSAFGYGGVGPAIVIEPLIELPTSATCTITLTAKPRDKDNEQFDAFEASFRTEGLTPAAVSDVAPTDTSVTVSFNVSLRASSVAGTVLRVRTAAIPDDEETPEDESVPAGPIIAGTTVSFDPESPTDATLTAPAGTFDVDVEYEILIGETIADSYGQAAGTDQSITFVPAE